MKFIHTDLGVIPAGSTVVARLSGTEANVKLLDDANFARYKRGVAAPALKALAAAEVSMARLRMTLWKRRLDPNPMPYFRLFRWMPPFRPENP